MANIYILANSLTSGGSERQIITLFKYFKNVKLILLENEIYYDVNFNENIILLSQHKEYSVSILKLIAFFISFFKLIKIIDKESIVISFLVRANIANVLLKYLKKSKAILTEGTQLSKAMNGPFKLFKILIIKYFYKKADLIIVNSKGIKKDLNEDFNIPYYLIKTLYNPIEIDEIITQSKEPLENEYIDIFEKPVIVTMGRLTKPKGQWHLIRIFKKIKEMIPEIKLIIISDGELRDYLINMSKNLGLNVYSKWHNKNITSNYDIYFLGFIKDPFKYIAKSKLFVFTSLWEGLPYTLIEAMVCGVPVISSDCRSGPREILAPKTKFEYETKEPEFSEYGILMPVCDGKMNVKNTLLSKEEKIWADVLLNLMKDHSILHKYSHLGKKRIKDFSAENIYQSWQNILHDLLKPAALKI